MLEHEIVVKCKFPHLNDLHFLTLKSAKFLNIHLEKEWVDLRQLL